MNTRSSYAGSGNSGLPTPHRNTRLSGGTRSSMAGGWGATTASSSRASVGGGYGLAEGMAGISLQQPTTPRRASSSAFGGGSGGGSRRSSVFARAQGTGIVAQPVAPQKDPRPIRDKAWQNGAIRSLVQFLIQEGYENPVSQKSLNGCSQKDFQAIVKFLYGKLDPSYRFGERKFEEELPAILRSLHYPYMDTITNRNIMGVGTINGWPYMLAMLSWVEELVICCNSMDSMALDGDSDDPLQADQMFLDYLLSAYPVYLRGDSTDFLERKFVEDFDSKNELVRLEVNYLNNQKELIDEEYKALTSSESPLIAESSDLQILEKDKKKFQDYILKREQKLAFLEEGQKTLIETLAAREQESAILATECADLSRIVDAQLISPADVDRMNAERDALTKALDALAAKLDTLTKNVWDSEMTSQKKMDSLERHVASFNHQCLKLGLNKVKLEADTATTVAEKVLSISLDAKIKPVIVKIKEKYSVSLRKTQEDIIGISEKLDEISWNLSQKQEQMDDLQAEINRLNERYKHDKEHIGKQQLATNEEMASYEQQIRSLKEEAAALLYASQQKLQKLTSEYEALSRHFAEEKECRANELVTALGDVLNFQQHISDSLSGLQSLAAMEE